MDRHIRWRPAWFADVVRDGVTSSKERLDISRPSRAPTCLIGCPGIPAWAKRGFRHFLSQFRANHSGLLERYRFRQSAGKYRRAGLFYFLNHDPSTFAFAAGIDAAPPRQQPP
jgi:hypothetical protein